MLVAGLQAAAYGRFLQRVAADPRHRAYIMPLRYAAQAAGTLTNIDPAQTVYLSERDLEGHVIPLLARQQRPWIHINPSIFLFPASGTPAWYLVQHDSFARQFADTHLGPPAAAVRTSTGAPAFELFQVQGGEAGQFLQSSGFSPMEAYAGQAIQLVGYKAGPLQAGQTSQVQVAWRVADGAALEGTRISQFVHLTDASGKAWSSGPDLWDIAEPWSTGDLVVSQLNLTVSPLAGLGGYWLETGFYQTFSGQPLLLTQNGRSLGSALRLGPLRVAAAAERPAPGQAPLGTFEGARVALLQARWRGDDVTLEWRALDRPPASYTVFVHVLDGGGDLVAQQDGVPRDGSFPTGLWQAGDVVQDIHRLSMAPTAGMHLEVGLYTRPDIRRILVQVPGEPGMADHVVVYPSAGQ